MAGRPQRFYVVIISIIPGPYELNSRLKERCSLVSQAFQFGLFAAEGVASFGISLNSFLELAFSCRFGSDERCLSVFKRIGGLLIKRSEDL